MTLTTYLSKYVYNIFVEFGKLKNTDEIDCITPRLTYKWKKIEEIFGEVEGKLIFSAKSASITKCSYYILGYEDSTCVQFDNFKLSSINP